jgi:hypothetical protein
MNKIVTHTGLNFATSPGGRQKASVSGRSSFFQPALLHKLLLITTFVVFTSLQLFAANKTFTGPGNFSDASKWGGSLPAAGDNLRINGVCTIDNNAGTDGVAYGTIRIGYASAGTIQWVSAGTNILNVTSVSTQVSGTLNMTNGGRLIIRGSWSSSGITFTPGSGTIEIRSGLTLPSAYNTYNNLEINRSGSTVITGIGTTINGNLTVTQGTFRAAGFSLAVSGNTDVSGALTITSATGTKSFNNLIINGTFTNSANVAITVSGNFENNGTYNGGTGRVTFTGAASNTISGTSSSTAFSGGITVNKGTSNSNVLDVQSVITLSSGGLILTNGTFKLSSASTITPFTANITGSPYLIPATAGLWNNGGTISASSIPWTIAGLLRVSSGTTHVGNAIGHYLQPIAGSDIIINGGTLKVADRISNTAAAWNYTMTAGTLVVPYVGNTTASRPPFNMDVTGCEFSMSGGVVIIPNAGGSAGQNLGFYCLATSGSGFTGGTLQIGDATTASGEIMGITSSSPVYNLSVNSSNATAIFQTSGLTVTNDVNISSGVLNLNSLPLAIGGTLTKAGGATFAPGTATVTLNGAEASNIGANGFTSFHNLTVNTSGATLGADIAVTGTLDLIGGSLSLSTFNLTLGATSTISNVTSDRYIKTNDDPSTGGFLVQPVSGSKLFPVGTSTYTPITVSNSGTADNFRVRVFDGLLTNGTSGGPHVFEDHAVNKTWLVEEVLAGGSNVTLTMQWNAADENNNFVRLGCGVFHYTNNDWDPPATYSGATVVSPGVYTMSRSGISSFSPFGVGDDVKPLPVEFLEFNATCIKAQVQLMWSTATEINNSHFAIERSADGNSFETIGSVEGSGNSNSILFYEFTDISPLTSNVSYYRLRQVDFDGTTAYSMIKAVKTPSNQLTVAEIYPMPAGETVNVNLNNVRSGTWKVEIFDLSGRVLFQETHSLASGMQTLQVTTANLPQGTYLLSIRNDSENHSLKLVK